VRPLADKQFALLKEDPRHPSLHFKRVRSGALVLPVFGEGGLSKMILFGVGGSVREFVPGGVLVWRLRLRWVRYGSLLAGVSPR
jgi:hypothetical protein